THQSSTGFVPLKVVDAIIETVVPLRRVPIFGSFAGRDSCPWGRRMEPVNRVIAEGIGDRDLGRIAQVGVHGPVVSPHGRSLSSSRWQKTLFGQLPCKSSRDQISPCTAP